MLGVMTLLLMLLLCGLARTAAGIRVHRFDKENRGRGEVLKVTKGAGRTRAGTGAEVTAEMA